MYCEITSIVPTDLKEAVETVSQAVTSGVVNVKTAVEYLNMNSDPNKELKLLNKL